MNFTTDKLRKRFAICWIKKSVQIVGPVLSEIRKEKLSNGYWYDLINGCLGNIKMPGYLSLYA